MHTAADTSPWFTVGVVVVLQGPVELFVARNYAVAVVFITPLALTIGTAGTLLTACIARVLASAATAINHLGAGTHDTREGRSAQRDLDLDMQEMSAAAGRGMQDDPAGVAPLLDVRESTAWLGFTVLARSSTQTAPASRVEGAAWACRVLARQASTRRLPSAADVDQARAAVGDVPPPT